MNLTYQIEKSKEILEVLNKYNLCYLFGETRSGKTLTSFFVANKYNNVLFVTTKKAISSILEDYSLFDFKFNIEVVNYESIHKIKNKYDFLILDEAHSLGMIPKPSVRQKLIKKLFYKTPMLLMSGTPAVESYSKLYPQFAVSDFSPFKNYKNFYRFADDFVNKGQIQTATHIVPCYKNAKVNEIEKAIQPYKVVMVKDINLFPAVTETILKIQTPERLQYLANKILKDKVLKGNDTFILGDTPVKLQSKVHQIVNGHCILEDANTKIFDTYKADYIKEKFKGKKIAIMYYYQAELFILKSVFDNITTDIEVFNNSDCNIAVQQSSTEGQNLSKADAIVFMNLGFSGKNYLQSRDRLTIRGRETNEVYYICEDFGLTDKILKTVQSKRDFNIKAFMQWQNNNQS